MPEFILNIPAYHFTFITLLLASEGCVTCRMGEGNSPVLFGVPGILWSSHATTQYCVGSETLGKSDTGECLFGFALPGNTVHHACRRHGVGSESQSIDGGIGKHLVFLRYAATGRAILRQK